MKHLPHVPACIAMLLVPAPILLFSLLTASPGGSPRRELLYTPFVAWGARAADPHRCMAWVGRDGCIAAPRRGKPSVKQNRTSELHA